MSYADMDHAGWVERNGAAAKRQYANSHTKSGRRKRRDTTKGWIAMPEKLDDFYSSVMDILGMTFGGIYNAPICWEAIQWQYGRGIAVPVRDIGLATWDFQQLTRLVFLCHEARIRCEIRTHSFRHMLLCFWPREDSGGVGRRHPNLDEAVAAFREYLPANHRIVYRAEEQKSEDA